MHRINTIIAIDQSDKEINRAIAFVIVEAKTNANRSFVRFDIFTSVFALCSQSPAYLDSLLCLGLLT